MEQYLKSWGLRPFTDEASYYRWQQACIPADSLVQLNQLLEARHHNPDPTADMAFYNLSASPSILPILYSQRYGYYQTIGSAIAARIGSAQQILDFGCGVGLLTIYYAQLFPQQEFVGIDRSAISIDTARQQAAKRKVRNVRFERCHIPHDSLLESFDLIIATQALFQAEYDAGLPSQNWDTFARAHDVSAQLNAEIRTGVKERLDGLCLLLAPGGRMLVCEKARHTGRRIMLQRALQSRGFSLMANPLPLSYRDIDEVVDEGPLYDVKQGVPSENDAWNEAPDMPAGQSLYCCHGTAAQTMGSLLLTEESGPQFFFHYQPWGNCHLAMGRWKNILSFAYLRTSTEGHGMILGGVHDEHELHQRIGNPTLMPERSIRSWLDTFWPFWTEQPEPNSQVPCYENHTPSSQIIWRSLPNRRIHKEETVRESDGRSVHLELGSSDGLLYLYVANTYDQRQLVMMDNPRSSILEAYYLESLAQIKAPSPA